MDLSQPGRGGYIRTRRRFIPSDGHDDAARVNQALLLFEKDQFQRARQQASEARVVDRAIDGRRCLRANQAMKEGTGKVVHHVHVVDAVDRRIRFSASSGKEGPSDMSLLRTTVWRGIVSQDLSA